MTGTYKSVTEISNILLEDLVKEKKNKFTKGKNEQKLMKISWPHFKLKICLSKKILFLAFRVSVDYKIVL